MLYTVEDLALRYGVNGSRIRQLRIARERELGRQIGRTLVGTHGSPTVFTEEEALLLRPRLRGRPGQLRSMVQLSDPELSDPQLSGVELSRP